MSAVERATPIMLTDNAINKVKSLVAEEENDKLMLRAFIQGGGCSGFEYGFTFDEEINDDDKEINTGGITLLVDSTSFQYLKGAKIDYTEGVEGAQFAIDNPNANNTCSCGSSFSVSDEETD